MLTSFGKALRKFRVDQGLLLRDMAKTLGVSSAFLSAVETGRKSIPDSFVDKICDAYQFDPQERFDLEEAKANSQKQVRLDLQEVSPETRGVALAFAKRFESLSKEDLTKIYAILEKAGDKNV